MSAVVLVPNPCHPTVLRLRPFSSNNACEDGEGSRTGSGMNRGFPVLAVTRGSRGRPRDASGRPLQRVMSERSPRQFEREPPVAFRRGQRAQSEYMDRSHAHDATLEAYRTAPDAVDVDDVTDFNDLTGYVDLRENFNVGKDSCRTPESIERLTFSDHLVTAVPPTSYSASMNASMNLTSDVGTATPTPPSATTTTTSVSTATTGTAMTRPVIKSPPLKNTDKRYYLPHNGIWRAVTFTPGEVDLHRYAQRSVGEAVVRDAVVREAGVREEREARRGRYKLNASQIPRSNTPVMENDPDKLNMKQVIAFLQSRGAKVSAPPTRQQIRQSRISSVDIGQPRPDNGCSGVDLALRPTKGGQRAAHVSSFPSQRARHSAPQPMSVVTYSGMPLRSSPPLVRRAARTSGKEEVVSTVIREEARNFLEEAPSEKQDSSVASSSFKSVRQFRLHRFLSAAPGAAEVKSALNGREGSPAPSRPPKTVAFADEPSFIPPEPPHDIVVESRGHNAFNPSPALTSRVVQERSDARSLNRFGRRSETDVIRRRLPQRAQSGSLLSKSRRQRLKSAPPTAAAGDGVIRLPSVSDLPPDSENDSDKDDARTHLPAHPDNPEDDVMPDEDEVPESEMELLRSFESSAKPSSASAAKGRRDSDELPRSRNGPMKTRPSVNNNNNNNNSNRRASAEGSEPRSCDAVTPITLQRLSSNEEGGKTPEGSKALWSPTVHEGVTSPLTQASVVASPSPTTRYSPGTPTLMTSLSPRKLRVKMPREPSAADQRETPTPRSPEVVKLTLRKERTRTREHTYLTDLEDSPRMAWGQEMKTMTVTTCDVQTTMSPRSNRDQHNPSS